MLVKSFNQSWEHSFHLTIVCLISTNEVCFLRSLCSRWHSCPAYLTIIQPIKNSLSRLLFKSLFVYFLCVGYIKDSQSEKTGLNSLIFPHYDGSFHQSLLQVAKVLHLRISQNVGTSKLPLFFWAGVKMGEFWLIILSYKGLANLTELKHLAQWLSGKLLLCTNECPFWHSVSAGRWWLASQRWQ